MMKTHKSLVWMAHYIPPFPNRSVGLKKKKTIEKQGVKKPWLKNLVLVPVQNSDPVLV
jgi:hypothetical protein